jgi:hypothetical protein
VTLVSQSGGNWFGLVGVLRLKWGVTLRVCYRGVETLDFACSSVVLELVGCGEIVVCIFVRMKVEQDYWCLSNVIVLMMLNEITPGYISIKVNGSIIINTMTLLKTHQ